MKTDIIDLQILGGSCRLPQSQFCDKRTVNMYDALYEFGKKIGYVGRFSGIKRKVTSMIGSVGRQSFEFQDKLYVVISQRVYQIDTSFTPTLIGTLNTSVGYVGIDANQKEPTPQIIFVDGVDGWIWDGDSFDEITDTDFPGQPIDVAYCAGRFFVASAASNYVGLSDLNDGFAYQSANRIYLQNDNDTSCNGVISLNGKVTVFGTESMQIFNNVGGQSPPFRTDTTFQPNTGLASTASVAINQVVDPNGNPSSFFLGATKKGFFPVMKMTGLSLQKISPKWVDALINNLTNPADCIGDIYTEGGCVFYQLSFNTDNKTLVYNDTIGDPNKAWSEKEMLNKDRYIGQCYAYFNGVQCMLSCINGWLYDISSDYLDNDGEPIRWLIKTAPFTASTFNEVECVEMRLDVTKGIGTANPPDNLPTVRLRTSTNSGITYGNTIEQPLAQIGDYSYYTQFEQVAGMYNARSIVFEIECTSTVDYNIFGGTLQYRIMER